MRWSHSGIAVAAGLAGSAVLYPDGPPPARTGGFGEPTCQTCHVGGGLVLSDAALSLDELPRAYVPGATYRLTVRLSREQMGRAGFQIAARFADGRAAGGQAGVLAALDSTTRVALFSARAVQYLSHTRAGSALFVPDTARWTFDWTAPPSGGGGAVLFHIAANAANDDASEFGDVIYTRAYRVPPRPESR